jgi:hypothetical protein
LLPVRSTGRKVIDIRAVFGTFTGELEQLRAWLGISSGTGAAR